MKRKKVILIAVIIVIIAIVGVGGYGLYEYMRPPRDVQSTEADHELSVQDLVKEYLADEEKANEKYLSEDGNSNVFILKGRVESVEENQDKQKVVLLKAEDDEAGFKCTFLSETSKNANGLKQGDEVKIKGVITVGPRYDADFEEHTHGVLENCDIAK